METIRSCGNATRPRLADMASVIQLGDHLVADRDGYAHHGIYAGNGRVIHYGGFHRSTTRQPVEYVQLHAFAAGREIKVHPEPDAMYRGTHIVERAKSRLGEDRYRLLTNNCEHFCTWCVLGVQRSEQVRRCLINPWAGIKALVGIVGAMRRASGDSSKIPRSGDCAIPRG
ncbi:lecithin retinol acyltransferase family protein [Paraburkholderia youngii]|uniref:lecithin retinol acyltransferase family protein n=1 Tax=Paraburkholderia youngii TaxID=2782701 RepID=UPI003D211597